MSTETEIPRPDFVTDQHLEFLDDLRESGVTNIFGSPWHVQRVFKVNSEKSRAIVSYWMKTFSKGTPRKHEH